MSKNISTVIQEMKRHRDDFMKKSTPYRQLNRAIKQLNKLEEIEKMVDNCDSGMISCEQLFLDLRTIFEEE